ncbi:MAG: glycosyl hydrolase-related protein [Promethearchaeota archaeon]
MIFNPLPWQRIDIVKFNCIAQKTVGEKFPYNIKMFDSNDNEIEYQHHYVDEHPRYTQKKSISHEYSFLAEIPACGYKTYYVVPVDPVMDSPTDNEYFIITRDFLENEYYRINIKSNGFIEVIDKETGIVYENLCEFEDMGDWGDEYDFSGPKDNELDLVFNTEDAAIFERSVYIDGPTQKTFKLRLNLKLPYSLTEDRYNREEWLVDNKITMYISLYKGIKRIDFKIELENNSKDHRIRILFPTKIKTDEIFADGHFYVVPRKVKLPNAENWVQKPLAMNHQKDFVSISNDSSTFAILNKGLPEYEAILDEDNTITFGITLLRCVEWLSRDDFETRMSHAGPGLKTPGAQCLGKYSFELAIVTSSKSNWLESKIHLKGKEFNNPLRPIFPAMVQSPFRISEKVILKPKGVLSYFFKTKKKEITPYLPSTLKFLEINNKSVVLSAIKKAEMTNSLIIRCYNISSQIQEATIIFYEKFSIKNAELVNLLEEKPKNDIKAKIIDYKQNILKIKLDPHVISTFKIDFDLS